MHNASMKFDYDSYQHLAKGHRAPRADEQATGPSLQRIIITVLLVVVVIGLVARALRWALA